MSIYNRIKIANFGRRLFNQLFDVCRQERFGEPGQAGFFQEDAGVHVNGIAGYKDETIRQEGEFLDGFLVKVRAKDVRHKNITHDQIVAVPLKFLQGSLAVWRSFNRMTSMSKNEPE